MKEAGLDKQGPELMQKMMAGQCVDHTASLRHAHHLSRPFPLSLHSSLDASPTPPPRLLPVATHT